MHARSRRSCVLCDGPLGPMVNAMLASGKTPNAIERDLRQAGHRTKRETISAHRRQCLGDDPVSHVQLEALSERVDAGAIDSDAAFRADLARIVQSRAIRELERGDVRVTVRDGLRAQQLIDRRAERNKDREFMIGLARLLSGGGQPPPPQLLDDPLPDPSPRD